MVHCGSEILDVEGVFRRIFPVVYVHRIYMALVINIDAFRLPRGFSTIDRLNVRNFLRLLRMADEHLIRERIFLS